MIDAISDFATWLMDVLGAMVDDLIEILKDVAIWVYGQVTELVVAALEAIPDFDALAAGVLQSAFGSMDSGIIYLAQASGFGTCAAIVGTGYAAYWIRRIVTLGKF